MKVAVVFCKQESDFVKELLGKMAEKKVPAVGYHIGKNWEQLDGEELTYHLQQISHFVILANHDLQKTRWLAYVIGCAVGKSAPVYLHAEGLTAQEIRANVPKYVTNHTVFTDFPEMLEELEQELNIDTLMQQIEFSRDELTSMGFALTEEAMVSAVLQGNLEAVRHFIQIGFSADTIDNAGVPVLNLAARGKMHQIMQLLLDNGADINKTGEDRKTSALMESAVLGDSTGVSMLIQYGPEPDLQSASGQTALMMAVGEGNIKIAMQLLDYGAKSDPVDALGMSAYKYAKLFNHTVLIEKMESLMDEQPENLE